MSQLDITLEYETRISILYDLEIVLSDKIKHAKFSTPTAESDMIWRVGWQERAEIIRRREHLQKLLREHEAEQSEQVKEA